MGESAEDQQRKFCRMCNMHAHVRADVEGDKGWTQSGWALLLNFPFVESERQNLEISSVIYNEESWFNIRTRDFQPKFSL